MFIIFSFKNIFWTANYYEDFQPNTVLLNSDEALNYLPSVQQSCKVFNSSDEEILVDLFKSTNINGTCFVNTLLKLLMNNYYVLVILISFLRYSMAVYWWSHLGFIMVSCSSRSSKTVFGYCLSPQTRSRARRDKSL